MVSISAPTSLASFTASRASSSKLPHVSLSPVEGSNGKLGVATVQGDGVWTYDLVTMGPVSTYTVPPATRFAAPAISYVTHPAPTAGVYGKGKGKAKAQADDGGEVADAAQTGEVDEDIELSSSVDSEEGQAEPSGPVRRTMVPVQCKGGEGEIWLWEGEDGGEKTVIELQHPVHAIHLIPDAPYPAIAINNPSQLSLIGPRSTVHPISSTSSSSASSIVASRLVPFDAASSGLITVSETGHVTSLRIEHPEDGSPSSRITSESQITLPIGSAVVANGETPKKGKGKAAAARIASADIRDDGLIGLFLSTGEVLTYDTRSSAVVGHARPLAAPNPASAITLLSTRKAVCVHATAKSPSAPASLVASLSSVSPAVVGAVDIASALPTEQSSVTHLSVLARRSQDSYVLGMVAWHPTQTSTPGAAAQDRGGRSIVHLVEVSAPPSSVGMNALLGSAERTAKYLETPRGVGKGDGEGAAKPSASTSAPSHPLAALLDLPKRASADWSSVLAILASSRATTLPSSALVQVLKAAIAEGQLTAVYLAILDLPPPDSTYRLELRRQLSAEDACALLAELVRHAEAKVEQDEGVKWNADDQAVPTKPTLTSVLTHLSLLLDSLLPILIDHAPAHDLLSSASDLLGPMLEQQRTLSQLRAPIDALLTLAKREERRRAMVREKRAAMRSATDGQGKVKSAEQERMRANRGGGQGGRLGLGGDVGLWSVEDFDF